MVISALNDGCIESISAGNCLDLTAALTQHLLNVSSRSRKLVTEYLDDLLGAVSVSVRVALDVISDTSHLTGRPWNLKVMHLILQADVPHLEAE